MGFVGNLLGKYYMGFVGNLLGFQAVKNILKIMLLVKN